MVELVKWILHIIVGPDYKIIFEPMVVKGEHQSTPVGDNKIRMMNYYRILQIHDENLTQLGFFASKIPKEKHKQRYSVVHRIFLSHYSLILVKKTIPKD